MYLSNFCLNSKQLGSHYSHSPLRLQSAPMTGKSITFFFFSCQHCGPALSSGTKQQSNSPTWPLLWRVPSCPVSYWPSFLFQPVFRLLFSHSFFLWFVISPVFFFFFPGHLFLVTIRNSHQICKYVVSKILSFLILHKNLYNYVS